LADVSAHLTVAVKCTDAPWPGRIPVTWPLRADRPVLERRGKPPASKVSLRPHTESKSIGGSKLVLTIGA
jgi:hypothetical protein